MDKYYKLRDSYIALLKQRDLYEALEDALALPAAEFLEPHHVWNVTDHRAEVDSQEARRLVLSIFKNAIQNGAPLTVADRCGDGGLTEFGISTHGLSLQAIPGGGIIVGDSHEHT